MSVFAGVLLVFLVVVVDCRCCRHIFFTSLSLFTCEAFYFSSSFYIFLSVYVSHVRALSLSLSLILSYILMNAYAWVFCYFWYKWNCAQAYAIRGPPCAVCMCVFRMCLCDRAALNRFFVYMLTGISVLFISRLIRSPVIFRFSVFQELYIVHIVWCVLNVLKSSPCVHISRVAHSSSSSICCYYYTCV